MIKEKKKKSKYNFKKNRTQILVEYIRTIFCAIIVGIIITTGLAINARNEMIKDITFAQEEQNTIDKKHAQEIINQRNLLEDLNTKTYSVCMHIGEIYEAAGDFANAQKAYELAILKLKTKTYKPYQRLIYVLAAQGKFEDANSVLDNINDKNTVALIKFKTRSYITIADKLYSIGKFLSAAKTYERANYYYNKFSKKDKQVENAIHKRIVNSYIQVADIMVKNGLNTDAYKFLKKAEFYDNNNFTIQYKLAIVLSDLDPENAIPYFEKLLEEKPQEIDYDTYNTALIKAANIADLDNRHTQAKYYRYKIKSNDLFVKRKVIYKNDIEVNFKDFKPRKKLFNYPVKTTYSFLNISNTDIINLKADFILNSNNKKVEEITMDIATKNRPLLTTSLTPELINVNFKKKIFSKKDLESYKIKVYLYKDERYKTYIGENIIYSSK